MTLSYLPVSFRLGFSASAVADTAPLFVLRSVMGKELRAMCCMSRKSACQDCMYCRTCAYAFLFETILPKENEVVPGRNRASHPFSFTKGSLLAGKRIEDYEFTIALFGMARAYLPYIYTAFVRAGKKGLFKSRTPYTVCGVTADGRSILTGGEHLDTNLPQKILEISGSGETRTGEVLVELKSPLRFKAGGRYTADFTARDFMCCLYRRAVTLCQLYGNCGGQDAVLPGGKLSITERELRWTESVHYSARQKRAMELGGLTGTLKLSGIFTAVDIGLLELACMANAGKNTNFGLGQMDFWPRWE